MLYEVIHSFPTRHIAFDRHVGAHRSRVAALRAKLGDEPLEVSSFMQDPALGEWPKVLANWLRAIGMLK